MIICPFVLSRNAEFCSQPVGPDATARHHAGRHAEACAWGPFHEPPRVRLASGNHSEPSRDRRDFASQLAQCCNRLLTLRHFAAEAEIDAERIEFVVIAAGPQPCTHEREELGLELCRVRVEQVQNVFNRPFARAGAVPFDEQGQLPESAIAGRGAWVGVRHAAPSFARALTSSAATSRPRPTSPRRALVRPSATRTLLIVREGNSVSLRMTRRKYLTPPPISTARSSGRMLTATRAS